MPKSTAPSEIRFAAVPVDTMPRNAINSASGNIKAVIRAARRLPRKSRSTIITSPMPTRRFSMTVCVVTSTRLFDRNKARCPCLAEEVVLADELYTFVDPSRVGFVCRSISHQNDALHDVGLIGNGVVTHPRCSGGLSSRSRSARSCSTRTGDPTQAVVSSSKRTAAGLAHHAQAWCMANGDVRHVAHADWISGGVAVLVLRNRVTTMSPMSLSDLMRPRRANVKDCSPSDDAIASSVSVAVGSRWLVVTVRCPARASGRDRPRRGTPWSRRHSYDVDDAGTCFHWRSRIQSSAALRSLRVYPLPLTT